MHFHGAEIARPVPFYQVFKGNLFKQLDQAIDFVLSTINRSVGTRAEGPQAPVQYELPKEVVAEAIVNAVAHRDYASGAAVQVSVFADRLEVWNPGELPAPLTPERLRLPHSSILRNHRICEALFLTRYIEKFGTGTLMMIRESTAHGLPEPQFEQRAGEFVTTLWRDWLTKKMLESSELNDRQRKGILQVKATGSVTSGDYQELTGAAPRTATRDLDDLVAKGLLRKIGKIGRGAHYVQDNKSARNQPNRPTQAKGKSAINRPNRPSIETRHKPDKPATVKGATEGPKGPAKAASETGHKPDKQDISGNKARPKPARSRPSRPRRHPRK